MIRVTKEFTFELGHALYGYDGLCKNVHGHSYKLDVTIIGKIINDPKDVKNGMVMDFSDLKKIVKKHIVDKFDHATVLNKNTPHKDIIKELNKHCEKVIEVAYQPTCENMLVDFSNILLPKLPSNIKLYSLKLRETPTSYAEWYATDNE